MTMKESPWDKELRRLEALFKARGYKTEIQFEEKFGIGMWLDANIVTDDDMRTVLRKNADLICELCRGDIFKIYFQSGRVEVSFSFFSTYPIPYKSRSIRRGQPCKTSA